MSQTISGSCTGSHSTDIELLVSVIGLVETGDDDTAIGKDGERGRYQIMEGVWYSHTTLPFTHAHMLCHAVTIAKRHVQRLATQVPNSPYDLALAWHCGVRGSRKPTKTSKDYASRVANLYTEIIGKRFNQRIASLTHTIGANADTSVAPNGVANGTQTPNPQ